MRVATLSRCARLPTCKPELFHGAFLDLDRSSYNFFKWCANLRVRLVRSCLPADMRRMRYKEHANLEAVREAPHVQCMRPEAVKIHAIGPLKSAADAGTARSSQQRLQSEASACLKGQKSCSRGLEMHVAIADT